MKAPWEIIQGDCLDVLPTLAENSLDACVTDGPYGYRFMDKAWDGADIEARVAKRREYHQDEDPRTGRNGGHNSRAAEAGKYNRSAEANRAFEDFNREIFTAVFRVLKPGAHLLAFGGTRTFHRLACAIEDAGFEMRDTIMWVHGQGFPKSLDVGKAMGKLPIANCQLEMAKVGAPRSSPLGNRSSSAASRWPGPWRRMPASSARAG
jgi:DNA modification methylase